MVMKIKLTWNINRRWVSFYIRQASRLNNIVEQCGLKQNRDSGSLRIALVVFMKFQRNVESIEGPILNYILLNRDVFTPGFYLVVLVLDPNQGNIVGQSLGVETRVDLNPNKSRNKLDEMFLSLIHLPFNLKDLLLTLRVLRANQYFSKCQSVKRTICGFKAMAGGNDEIGRDESSATLEKAVAV